MKTLNFTQLLNEGDFLKRHKQFHSSLKTLYRYRQIPEEFI